MNEVGIDVAALVLRVALGVVMLAHGWNHVFRGGKLPGVARWFGSLGFRAPKLQAAVASYTELAAGVLLILGLLTPLGAAAVVGTMLVAFIANHRKNGFFIFRPGEGYEYVLTLILVAIALACIGGGRVSVDHLLGIDEKLDGVVGLLIAAGLGGGLGATVLAVFWRPQRPERPAPSTS
jgi:putative oxidoreductase